MKSIESKRFALMRETGWEGYLTGQLLDQAGKSTGRSVSAKVGYKATTCILLNCHCNVQYPKCFEFLGLDQRGCDGVLLSYTPNMKVKYIAPAERDIRISTYRQSSDRKRDELSLQRRFSRPERAAGTIIFLHCSSAYKLKPRLTGQNCQREFRGIGVCL